jgi:hypothetical protein
MYVDGMNDYAYVGNSPIIYYDHDGKTAGALVAAPLMLVAVGGLAVTSILTMSAINNNQYVSPVYGTSKIRWWNYDPCRDPTSFLYWTKECICKRDPKRCKPSCGSIFLN